MSGYILDATRVTFAARCLFEAKLLKKSKGPHRPSLRNVFQRRTGVIPVEPTQAGENRYVLLAVVGECDGLGVDTRSRLELPDRLASFGVDGDELTGFLASEKQAAGCSEHRGPLRMIENGGSPVLLRSEWIDGVHMC